MNKNVFKLKSDFAPGGDQPEAIKSLVDGLKKGDTKQTLLGVTGSGKTFTMANVIAQWNKPTLVIAHNKTLAAQLAQEYKEFFPDNAVHYFVSYYDYYQPEAYMPVTDTYIEKEAMINEEIDRLRHASTQALLTRKDVIIVASVSCIYGLGSPKEYEKENMKIAVGAKTNRADFTRRLIDIHFTRTTADLKPGDFRALGNKVEIMPVSEKIIYRISLEEDPKADGPQGQAGASKITAIEKIDAVSRRIISEEKAFFLFPAKHFITADDEVKRALQSIKLELEERLIELKKAGKNLEAERLKRRTNYDLASIREIGYTNGIENYSRHFSGKAAGQPPDSLLEYFPHKKDGSPDFLTIIDESHVALPQLRGMYAGDQSRKNTLVEHGFRLPSAKDNRPLKYDEFEKRVHEVIYTSATPSDFERQNSQNIVEQVIRPTGLIDPVIVVRPVSEFKSTKAKPSSSELDGRPIHSDRYPNGYRGQIFDFITEAQKYVKEGHRVIATTLTKKMAEDLTDYLKDKKIKAEYIHSDIKTIDRIQILTEFRRGKFDIIVGVNLLREGLDLPEVALIGILDADKEGFLRSETSLIQIIGRAARNVDGKVIIYADQMTGSITRAMGETDRRRTIQLAYNKKHNITPKTIIKNIKDITEQMESEHQKTVKGLLAFDEKLFADDPNALIKQKEKQMEDAAKALDFETAAILRDEITALSQKLDKQIKLAKPKKPKNPYK